MDIYGKINVYNKQKKFEDLKNGEVFYFTDKPLKDSSDIKVYMRGGHTALDMTAINLETGIMYSFDKSSPVKVLSARINIEETGK